MPCTGTGGMRVGLFPRLGRAVLVELDRGFGGGHSHAADGDGGLAGHLDQQRHLAAESEAAQFRDAGSQDAGHAGIHCVAAFGQDAVARLHFEIVGRRNHVMRGAHRRRHGGRVLSGENGEGAEKQCQEAGLAHGFILALSSIARYFRSSS